MNETLISTSAIWGSRSILSRMKLGQKAGSEIKGTARVKRDGKGPVTGLFATIAAGFCVYAALTALAVVRVSPPAAPAAQ